MFAGSPGEISILGVLAARKSTIVYIFPPAQSEMSWVTLCPNPVQGPAQQKPLPVSSQK